ncbi:helix-turn-helix transcriptional regulator [Actinomycetospora sp. NBRC 106378]|uniref:helix-turn-helix domain-containing protein n=1 Tax=Actinomycetospora sp. NBRC 106378 TaxID=3032208 RepID=UPI0024A30DFE|nr:helix-turn-helix transcriptional regulator [Actinomycetospora sp. NBRC 106378]GLZ54203.1 transcriptional regulator [Actinomycetospora sp. NBRC 106378]
MTDDPTPTTLRRQLGARLRQLRQEAGKTAQQVADDLDFSISKVSRMESGARAVSEPDLVSLIRYFGVQTGEAAELEETARGARRRREAWVDVVPPSTEFQRFVSSGFIDLERDAAYVREFNSGVVPGLLQTSEYMRAMMLQDAPEDRDVLETAISLRLGRQARLSARGRYSVIIDEAVLARVVGSSAVMHEQLQSIIGRCRVGAAEVRVIPFSAGFHPGLNSVFVALDMGRSGPNVVFIEGLVGFQRVDNIETITRFENVWQDLERCSASRAESHALLATYSDSYRRSRT